MNEEMMCDEYALKKLLLRNNIISVIVTRDMWGRHRCYFNTYPCNLPRECGRTIEFMSHELHVITTHAEYERFWDVPEDALDPADAVSKSLLELITETLEGKR